MNLTPSTNSRRGFLRHAIGALTTGAAGAVIDERAAQASTNDPVFALIAAYHKVRVSRVEIEERIVAAEHELEIAGDLHPHVISVGNPWSGLPPPASMTHKDIDLYTPVDMYPERNREEHAALSASIARRDAKLNSLQDALETADDAESAALHQVFDTAPLTLAGALAVFELRRDWVGT